MAGQPPPGAVVPRIPGGAVAKVKSHSQWEDSTFLLLSSTNAPPHHTIPNHTTPQPVSFAAALQLPCPTDLSPDHVDWLESACGSCSSKWEEVYRATTHGFRASDFHARCDGRKRLLVLIRTRDGGWLFGGYTAVGFIPGVPGPVPEPERYIADHYAFLYSLTNEQGRPEKLESNGTGKDLRYHPFHSACFGDLFICNDADTEAGSWTQTGIHYAESVSTGVHPMAKGWRRGWLAAEVVAWVV